MKLKSFLIPAAVAFASLASVASAANINVNFSDLILGFRSTVTPAQNLEVNLGSVSQFTEAAAGTTFTVANLNGTTDLANAAVFGASWYASTTTFGIIGTTGKASLGATGPDGQGFGTVWATGGSGSAPTVLNGTSLNNTAGQILLMTNGSTQASGALNMQDSSLMSNIYTANISTSGAASWSKVDGTTGNSFLNLTRSKFEKALSGTSVTTNLYEMNSVANGLVGSFTLTNAGVLTFTSAGLYAAAIPEPSTYAMIAGAFMLGFVALRRRFQK